MSKQALPQNIVQDDWLTVVLGEKTYALVWGDNFFKRLTSPGSSEYRQLVDLMQERVFVYAKVPATQLSALNFLESAGFRFIETTLVLHKAAKGHRVASGPHIRRAMPQDESAVYGLAGRSFSFSRFHLDGAFMHAQANRVKAEWTRSYFRGQRGTAMLVSVCGGDIVGFILLADGSENSIVIDLMAVDPAYRRRKIGSSLLITAGGLFTKRNMSVGTQSANIPSVQFYEKMGFRLYASYNVLHYHRG